MLFGIITGAGDHPWHLGTWPSSRGVWQTLTWGQTRQYSIRNNSFMEIKKWFFYCYKGLVFMMWPRAASMASRASLMLFSCLFLEISCMIVVTFYFIFWFLPWRCCRIWLWWPWLKVNVIWMTKKCWEVDKSISICWLHDNTSPSDRSPALAKLFECRE